MVTYINKNTRAKYAGDTLDNAPKNVQNGSVYFAMAEGKYYMYDAENDIWHEQMDNGSGGGGSGGTTDHSQLTNRSKPNQHPIGAITGLQDALDEKQPKGDYALKSDVPETAVLFTPMLPPLTPEQQEQAQKNIGITGGGGAPTGQWEKVAEYKVPAGGPTKIVFTKAEYPKIASHRQVIIMTESSDQWLESWSGLIADMGPVSVANLPLTVGNKQGCIIANADSGYWGGYQQATELTYFDANKWQPLILVNTTGTLLPRIYSDYDEITLKLSNNAKFPKNMMIRIFAR